MQQQSYQTIFQDEVILDAFEGRQPKPAVKSDCDHILTEEPSLDDSGNEQVCSKCGAVGSNEVPESAKLTGAMDVEDWWRNVSWGPATNVYLESFLVPTLARIRCRDRYVNVKILAKLRTYTMIQRVCSRFSIPQVLADDTMRTLLKRKKGLYSKYVPFQILSELIRAGDPRLHTRLPLLEPLATRPKYVPYNKGKVGRKKKAKQVDTTAPAKRRGRPRKLEALMLAKA